MRSRLAVTPTQYRRVAYLTLAALSLIVLTGAAVRLTLRPPVTAEPVLTVPVAAFVSAGHGRAGYVTVIRAGRRVKVRVLTGPTADGLVAVQPVRQGAIRPGDHVLIGAGRWPPSR